MIPLCLTCCWIQSRSTPVSNANCANSVTKRYVNPRSNHVQFICFRKPSKHVVHRTSPRWAFRFLRRWPTVPEPHNMAGPYPGVPRRIPHVGTRRQIAENLLTQFNFPVTITFVSNPFSAANWQQFIFTILPRRSRRIDMDGYYISGGCSGGEKRIVSSELSTTDRECRLQNFRNESSFFDVLAVDASYSGIFDRTV